MYADIGVNLTDKRFSSDVDEVITRALNAKVNLLVLTGTSISSSHQVQQLAESHSNLYCTAGIHPHDAKSASSPALEEIKQLARNEKVCAIGETGLDFNRDFSPRADQERSFEAHLQLAVDLKKPVFLHQRDSHERFLAILKSFRDQLNGAVVHCFTDSKKALFDYLDLDCHIGITGWICDERRGQELQELVHNIPDNRLLLETDSPYLFPRNFTEKMPKKGRNEPYLLPWIAAEIARHRNQNEVEMSAMVWQNSLKFFDLESPE